MFQEVNAKYAQVKEYVPKRDRSLQAELAKQQNHERTRTQFATLANKVGPWIQLKTEVRLKFTPNDAHL